ncbi:MAG: hypothetical protein Kow0080_27600 [Candidatus Promineifilaceae bacterium]
MKLYTSMFCAHSRIVETFLNDHEIVVEKISIDGSPEAREAVKALNNGYASVPTLVLDDGRILTEPSFYQLRQALGIEQPNLLTKVKSFFEKKS